MAYPWTPAIGELRRRAMVAGAFEGLGGFLPWVTPLAIGYVAWSLFSPWGRYLAPVAGLVLALVLLLVALVGAVRARHTDGYLAKWIDVSSALDDRLTSAVEWGRLERLGDFQHRCVEQLALQLDGGFWRLVLPRTAPRRWPLTLGLLLVLAGLPAAYLRRAAAPLEKDARTKVAIAPAAAKAATQALTEIDQKSQLLKDPQLEQLSTELASALREINEGASTRERSLERLERLRAQIEHAGGAGSRRASLLSENGVLGALARAINQGNATAISQALDRVSTALKEGSLGEQEVGDLAALLGDMTSTARPVNSAIAARLDEAGRRLSAGDQDGAAAALSELTTEKLQPVEHALAAAAALRRAGDTVDSITRAIGQAAAPEGEGGTGEPIGTGATTNLASDAVGAGATTADTRVANPTANGKPGSDVQVHSPWTGKVMRQLFDSSSNGQAGDEVKRMLVEHERVVEDRFQRDEVPQEYEEAVRTYFAALHRKGK